MIKSVLLLATILGLNWCSAQTQESESKKHLLVFIGGFGQTKHGVKKMMKDLSSRYTKLNDYEVMCFPHTNSKRKIKKKIEAYNPEQMTMACFSMGANKGLEIANEISYKMNFAFVDPWFLASKWQSKDSTVTDKFKSHIGSLPENSMIVYGSDFVVKNDKDLSKISGVFGSKNGQECYGYIRSVWADDGKVFRSGAGHKYFPELYVKQFLPSLKDENHL